MEQIVKEVLNIEKTAGKIVSAAREESEHLSEILQQNKQKMSAEYTERAVKRIELFRKNELSYFQNVLSEISENKLQKLKAMDDKYTENSEYWVSTLFEDIFGR